MKEKIEEILARFGSDIGIYDIDNFNTALKELSTLIQQEREEAVRGFVEYMQKQEEPYFYKFDLGSYLQEYLQSLDKGETDENR